MSIGGGASSGTSQTQLDPQIKGDWQDLFNQASSTAAAPTPQQQVAGFTADQNLGQSYAAGEAGAGVNAENDAVSNLSRLADSSYAPNVTAQLNGGVAGVTGATQGDLSSYLNPYTQDVINTTMSQADLARQQDINSNQAGITSSGGEGAWNGARVGVQNAQTNALIQGQEASQLAGLNQGNYTNAQSQANTYNTLDQAANLANQSTNTQTVLANQNANNAAEALQTGYLNDTANRQLSAAQAEGAAAPTQQGLYQDAANTLQTVGATQQAQQQAVLNAAYQNAQNTRNEPIQTIESAFGIIPSTGSGSVTNSSGKSGQIGTG